MYIPKYFKIQELVPKEVYKDLANYAWSLIDNRVLLTLDQLRKRYGAIIINTWYYGGDAEWRGLRPVDCPIGSKYSQHKYGRAADCTFKYVRAETVRGDILNNPRMFPHINAIELDVSWLHFDVRNCQRIKSFKP